ncbi:MAG: aminotransferase class I/II-fold pyridoxal phosphate-dependent enzyme [Clostridia bacterium]|nr:aminotransferase class I/II-fold pyridoxal phosphate-dependent enzyme [Clostridia bacterium]
MKFDFETLVSREHSGSPKEPYCTPEKLSRLVLPHFGAELDFPTSPYLSEGLTRRAAGGSYGYALNCTPEYVAAVRYWLRAARGWDISPEWLVPTNGVLSSVHLAILAFSAPGEGVIIQPPVFGAYRKLILRDGRVPLENRLIYERKRGAYRMDLDGLEALMRRPDARLMLLCNPQNPQCCVWGRAEMERIAELAEKYGVTVFSDEVFGELADALHPAAPFCAVRGGERVGLVATSLGKTFSFGSARHANIIVPDGELRRRFAEQRDLAHYDGMDPFMYSAVLAAYTPQNLEWIAAMRDYTAENARAVRELLAAALPQVRVCESHGGYLLWADWSGLGLETAELRGLLERAELYADAGEYYGEGCEQFTRIVIGCPRRYLLAAFERLRRLTGGGAV